MADDDNNIDLLKHKRFNYLFNVQFIIYFQNEYIYVHFFLWIW